MKELSESEIATLEEAAAILKSFGVGASIGCRLPLYSSDVDMLYVTIDHPVIKNQIVIGGGETMAAAVKECRQKYIYASEKLSMLNVSLDEVYKIIESGDSLEKMRAKLDSLPIKASS